MGADCRKAEMLQTHTTKTAAAAVTQLTVNAGPQRERTRGDTAPCRQAKVSWHGSAAVRQRIPHQVMGDFIMTTEPANQEIATALDVSTSSYRMFKCVKGGTGTARENG